MPERSVSRGYGHFYSAHTSLATTRKSYALATCPVAIGFVQGLPKCLKKKRSMTWVCAPWYCPRHRGAGGKDQTSVIFFHLLPLQIFQAVFTIGFLVENTFMQKVILASFSFKGYIHALVCACTHMCICVCLFVSVWTILAPCTKP